MVYTSYYASRYTPGVYTGPAMVPACVPLVCITCSTSIKQSGVHFLFTRFTVPPFRGRKRASFPARINPPARGSRPGTAKKPATERSPAQGRAESPNPSRDDRKPPSRSRAAFLTLSSRWEYLPVLRRVSAKVPESDGKSGNINPEISTR